MIKKIKDKEANNYKDTGFSEKPSVKGARLLAKDGSFNVKKTGLPFFDQFSLFHTLHQMSWIKFIVVAFAFYSLVNLIFSLAYLYIGVEGISGAVFESNFEEFMQAFYFSCQTITTVGFGALSPSTNTMQLVSSLEAFLGLMLFAIMTGILYGRFSKPRAQFVFSDKVLVSPYRESTGVMFRLANSKSTDMIEAEVQFLLSYLDEGKRKFAKLELERESIIFLPTTWTVVHPIDEASPIYGWGPSEFKKREVEFIATIKAFDNTFDQSVNSRTSYKFVDVEWGQKFVSAIRYDKNGSSIIDLSLVGAYDKA